MAEQYTNIRTILDRILRHPLMRELTLETAVDYSVDFIRIMGAPKMFLEKVECIEIKNYRAILPCDFNSIIQVRIPNGHALRASTDSFHMNPQKYGEDLTYKIQGNFIYTTFKEGYLELAYKAIAVDEEGYPLLPDNSVFLRALELYIKKNWFTVLFDLGKITPQVLQNTQQEYAWAVGQCNNEFNKLTLDEMESLKNSWVTLLQRTNEHATGFKYNSRKEKIKVH